MELIKQSLESGDDVLISGFGKFCVKKESKAKGQKSCHWQGHDAETQEVCHISMRGVAEGKLEQKVGYGKKKTR